MLTENPLGRYENKSKVDYLELRGDHSGHVV
jgi:hypothetical protein